LKLEAVRQVLEKGKRVTDVARKFEITRGLLYRWIELHRAELGSGSSEKRPGESELAHLKRQVAELREENSFLKKAAAYFAKERPRGTQ
jgi:transposase